VALGTMVALVIILAASPLFGVRFDVVLSGSMSPSLDAGDLAMVSPASADQLKVGDVIVFESPLGGGLVCHRIIVVNYGPEITFQTKGDNNEDPDPFMVEPERIVGKVQLSAPYLGYAVQWLRGPLGLLAIVALMALTFVIPSDKKRKSKEKAKEDVNGATENSR